MLTRDGRLITGLATRVRRLSLLFNAVRRHQKYAKETVRCPSLTPITKSSLTFSSCDEDCHKDVVVRHYGVLREDFHRRQFTLDALAQGHSQ